MKLGNLNTGLSTKFNLPGRVGKKKHKHVILKKSAKLVGKGLLKLLQLIASNPYSLVIFITVVVGSIAYLIYSIDYQLTQIMVQYQALSARPTDSKAGYDKRVVFVTTDANGNTTLTVGYQSEAAEEEAKQALEEAGQDPNGSPGTLPQGERLSQDEVAKKIIAAMQAEGYNKYAIIGVLGNCHWESGGLNTGCTQNHKCDGCSNTELRKFIGSGGRAVGLAQWDGGRAVGLLDAADAAGKDWYDADWQIAYLIADMPANTCSVDKFNNCISELNLDESIMSDEEKVEVYTFWFCKKFERCGTNKQKSDGSYYCASELSWNDRSYISHWSDGGDGRLKRAMDMWVTYQGEL